MKRYIKASSWFYDYLPDDMAQAVEDFGDDILSTLNNNIEELKQRFNVKGDIIFDDVKIDRSKDRVYIYFTDEDGHRYDIDGLQCSSFKSLFDLSIYGWQEGDTMDNFPFPLEVTKEDLDCVFIYLISEWGNKFLI